MSCEFMRGDVIVTVHEKIEALKRHKDDAKEVRDGLECGIKLGGFNDVKEGDLLEVYKIEEVARTLDGSSS